MNFAKTDESTDETFGPLRLWPGAALAVLLLAVRFLMPAIFPETLMYAVLGSIAIGLLIALWWLFFSRAPWADRLGATALLILALLLTRQLVHPSIATGMMGMMLIIYAVPVLMPAFVLAVALGRGRPARQRRLAIAAAVLLVCAGFLLIRTGGMSSDAGSDLAWRWSPTPEDLLLARGEAAGAAPGAGRVAAAGEAPATGDWPGFRGARRDGAAAGPRLAADWNLSPPALVWRRPVGPGWSSFAVHDGLIYTQEQRGEDEIVASYRLATGEPVWKHRDAARFWESNAGAGPRGTPTLHQGRIYSFGATGILNALDAATGEPIWSRDAAKETGATTPTWGFSSSPLVVGDQLVVAVSGRLVSYDLATGKERWRGPAGGASYSSPQLLDLDGVEQIVLLAADGATSVAPEDGRVLWQHAWPGYPIVQPATTADGDLLISVSDSSGTRRLDVSRQGGAWNATERWTSIGLKPYFNDFVVHEGHAYGFDGGILACIEVEAGKRRWKGGRYGQGQLLLLPEQDLLLVLSEQGELALVSATPDGFAERARFPAIEGKTWNHPVLLGDLLLVRNDQEMAAFRLPTAAS